MVSAGVDINEIDKSGGVSTVSGVEGFIVIPATRGKTFEPSLVTSQSDFLKRYTGNERVEVGMPLSYFSALTFLQKSNKLNVMRSHNRSTFGASVVRSSKAPLDFSTIGKFTIVGNLITVNPILGKKIKTGMVVQLQTDDTLPAPLSPSTYYYMVKVSETQFKVADSLANALATNPTVITITDVGTGNHEIKLIESTVSGVISSEFVTNQQTFKVPVALGRSIQTGTEVLMSSGGTIPTGLTNNSKSYVIKISDTQIKLASNYANALTGTNINITGAGTKDFNIILKTNSEFNYVRNFTINISDNTIVIPSDLGSLISTGDALNIDTEGALTGTGLTTGTYYAVKTSDTEFKLATSMENALLGVPVTLTLTAIGTGKHYVTKPEGALDPETYSFANSDELMLFRAKDQGNWSEKSSSGSVQYTIEDYRHKEPDTFKVKVFKTSNLQIPVEEFVCSRIKAKQDGDGRNIYIEDVLKGSFYLECIDNPLIDETEFPVINSVPVGFTGGDNGYPVTDSQMIEALQKASNPDDISIRLIMDGGWATVPYAQAINEIASARKDCLGILSCPIGAELSSDYLNELKAYRESLNINSSFVALYSSHQQIIDRFNSRQIYIPPDGFVGAIISATADNFEIWYPPAGWRRGTVSVIRPLIKYNKGERDFLYDLGINPFRFKPNRGVSCFGNKTLLSRPSALDRVNVRLLLTEIEPANADALEDFTFEINDVSARSELQSIVEEYMRDIQGRNGVYDFYVVCDDTNNSTTDIDNYKLELWLFVKPTKSAEFIKLSIIVTRTGSDFSVAISLV